MSIDTIESHETPKRKTAFLPIPQDIDLFGETAFWEQTLFNRVCQTLQFAGYAVNAYRLPEQYRYEENNPNFFGLFPASLNKYHPEHTQKAQEICKRYGIESPRSHSFRDIIALQTPTVIKHQEIHGGDSVLLLENSEQKSKFIAAVLDTPQNIENLRNNNTADIERRAKNSTKKTLNLLTEAELIQVDNFKVIYQEYIPPYEGFHHSMRVLVDMKGRIQYTMLNVKPIEYPEKHVELDENTVSLDTDILRYTAPWSLTNPQSPYYLSSKDIRSNITKGGSTHRVFPNPEDSVLPYKDSLPLGPTGLPDHVSQCIADLGTYYRRFLPWIGIDLIIDPRTENFHILEINTIPGINPKGLELKQEVPHPTRFLHLLERVIK